MATVIPIDRSARAQAAGKGRGWEANEQFWRRSLSAATIVMTVVVVLSLALAVITEETRIFAEQVRVTAAVIALVSVVGLVKILLANVVFIAMVEADAKSLESKASEPVPPRHHRRRRPRGRFPTAVR